MCKNDCPVVIVTILNGKQNVSLIESKCNIPIRLSPNPHTIDIIEVTATGPQ